MLGNQVRGGARVSGHVTSICGPLYRLHISNSGQGKQGRSVLQGNQIGQTLLILPPEERRAKFFTMIDGSTW